MQAPPETTAILVIFVLTYAGIAIGHVPGLRLNRTGIALLGAIAIMVFSDLPTTTLVGFIDWPTILLLFGFFVLSAQLRLSGFFDKVATGLSGRLENPARFLLTLMLVTAGLSAFLNHDIVCFVFAPVVGTALLRKRLNPIPFLVALAIASNIGAAATLVGNPQDMMIAQTAGLAFGPYMLWCITPVLLALGGAYALIWRLSRNGLAATGAAPVDDGLSLVPFDRPHAIKGLIILALVIAFFFSSMPKELIALTAAGFHLASPKFKTEDLLALVDWPILVLFVAPVRGDRRVPVHGLRRPARALARAKRRGPPVATRAGRGDGHPLQPDQQLRGRAAAGEGGERGAIRRRRTCSPSPTASAEASSSSAASPTSSSCSRRASSA